MEILILLVGAGLIGAFAGGGGGDGDDGVGAEDPPMAEGDTEITQEGDGSAESLVGSPLLDDVIFGRGGNDTITGDVGNDFLDGNSGDDEVSGDIGDDEVRGGAGDDLLDGGTGFDTLFGGEDNDTLLGGDGNDILNGGANADSLVGGIGNDILDGVFGADTLIGGAGNDTLVGILGSDTMLGGIDGEDTLVGIFGDIENIPTNDNSGVDVLAGGEGADFIVLGTGDEAFGEDLGGTEADGAGDTFVVGTWIGTPPPVIRDFDPSADTIDILFDPAAVLDAIPSITPDGDSFIVSFDGDPIVNVDVATPGDIVTLSQLRINGLTVPAIPV